MTAFNNTENVDVQDLHRSISESETQPCVLTREQVDEHNRSYVAPIRKQLEYLIWLIQRMKQTHPQHLPPRASISAKFAAAVTSFDNWYFLCLKEPKKLRETDYENEIGKFANEFEPYNTQPTSSMAFFSMLTLAGKLYFCELSLRKL